MIKESAQTNSLIGNPYNFSWSPDREETASWRRWTKPAESITPAAKLLHTANTILLYEAMTIGAKTPPSPTNHMAKVYIKSTHDIVISGLRLEAEA
jgi:hypothetical protein